MSDIKLFNTAKNKITELEGKSVQIEKSLQTLIESNLETFLGVRFLATEYGTGPKHGGRIDTLGIDENNCPAIIEYKRATNENVINQGLFYLDWLLDHKAEFELLVQKKYGKDVSENIEWGSTRLICIAGDYTKYDSYAVQQINRNIELIRYKKFEELLLLELVNSVSGENVTEGKSKEKKKVKYSTVAELLAKSSTEVKDLYESAKDFILGLGDDIQVKELLYYFAFKRIKTFASIEIHPQKNSIVVYVRLDPKIIKFEEGLTRDVTNIGHLGVGNIEIRINSLNDFEQAKPLILKSYESN
jgi:predicted transport protein